MEPIDPAVIEGRDPAWREWWEEHLDDTDRTRVESAVKDATRVSDPRLEPFVYGLIARSRRRLWLNVVLNVALVVTTGVQASLNPRWHGFWVAMLLTALTAVPWKLWMDAQRLSQAKAVQEARRGTRGHSA
jgi:hypothetical protein